MVDISSSSRGLMKLPDIDNLDDLESFKSLLSRDKCLGDADGEMWEKIFSALIKIIRREAEKSISSKRQSSSTSIIISRISSSGSIFRSMVEKGLEKLTKNAVKIIVSHILEVLSIKRDFFEYLFTEYIKALRTVVTYKPHRDHLTQYHNDIKHLCITSLVKDHSSINAVSDMSTLNGTLRGRNPNNELATPANCGKVISNNTAISYELARIFSALMLTETGLYENNREEVLKFFLVFFEQKKTETSCDPYLLAALNHFLREVILDATHQVEVFAIDCFPHILRLWDAKLPDLKSQTLTCTKILFDAIFEHPVIDIKNFAKVRLRLLSEVRLKFQAEFQKTNFALPVQRVDCTYNETASTKITCSPFCLRTIHGHKLEEKTTAWMFLDLAASVYLKALELERWTDQATQPKNPSPDGEEIRPPKKPRIINVLDEIKENLELTSSSVPVNRIPYLQMLLFLLEKHAESIHLEDLEIIGDILMNAITNSDPETFYWTCLCIRSVAYTEIAHSNLAVKWSQKVWAVAWSQASHGLTSLNLVQPSLILMHALLFKRCIPQELVIDVLPMILDITKVEGQIPTSAAAFAFLTHLMDILLYVDLGRRFQAVAEQIIAWVASRLIQEETIKIPIWLVDRSYLLCNLLMSMVGESSIFDDTPSVSLSVKEDFVSQLRILELKPLILFLHSGILPLQPKHEQLLDIVVSRDRSCSSRLKDSTRIICRDLVMRLLETMLKACRNDLATHRTSSTPRHITEVLSPRLVIAISACTIAIHSISQLIRKKLYTIQQMNDSSQLVYEILCIVRDKLPDLFEHPNSLIFVLEGINSMLQVNLWRSQQSSQNLAWLRGFMQPEDQAFRNTLFSDLPQKIIDGMRELTNTGFSCLAHLSSKRFVSEDEFYFKERIPKSFDLAVEFYDTSSLLACDDSVKICILSCCGVISGLLLLGLRSTNSWATSIDRLLQLSLEEFFVVINSVIDVLCINPKVLTQKQASALINRCFQLVNDYKFEFDQWAHILILRMLTSLSTAWIPGQKSEACETVSKIYDFFCNNLDRSKLSWRSRLELAKFLARYLTIDPEQVILATGVKAVGTVFMDFLRDNELTVRIYMSKAVSHLFNIYTHDEEDHIKLYHDIKEALPKPLQYETLVTRILTLEEIFIRSDMNRSAAIFDLFEAAAQGPIHCVFVQRSLERAAEFLGFASSLELFDEFAQHIFYLWISSHNLAHFPFQLLDRKNLEDFVQSYSQELVPQFVFQRKFSELKKIADMSNVKLKELLEKNYGRIIALVLPLYFHGEDGINKANESIDYLEKMLGNDTQDNLFTKNVVLVIFHLLMSIENPFVISLSTGAKAIKDINSILMSIEEMRSTEPFVPRLPEPHQPFHSTLIVYATLEHVANTLKKSVSKLFSISKLTRLLQLFHEILQRAKLPELRRRILAIYRFAIALGGKSIHSLGLAKLSLHAMVTFLSRQELCSDCCGIIEFICHMLRETNPETFIYILVDLLPRLIDRVMSYSLVPADEKAAKRIVFSLERLMNDACGIRSLIGATSLSKIGPFPSTALFQGVRQFHERIRESLGLSLDLANYEHSLNTASTIAAIQASITELRSNLKSPPLQTILHTSAHNPDLDSLIIKLIKLCIRNTEETRATTFKADVCRCLAEVFPFSFGISRSVFHYIDISPFTMGLNQNNKNAQVFVLSRLADYLSDEDTQVVGAAVKSLYAILSTTAGDSAFNKLEAKYSMFLSNFRNSSISKKLKAPIASRTCSKIDQNLVWSSEKKPYNHWIIDICRMLIDSYIVDEVLGRLSDMISVKAEFAKDLLPYLIHNVLGTGDLSIRQVLSYGLRSFFMHYEQQSRESLRTLLGVVIFLRHRLPPHAGTSFESIQWLDLDYLDLSKAALLCGAYTAALLFFELHCETGCQNHGTNDNKQNELSYHHQHLLTIFQNIDEPDSFYGITAQTSFSSLSRRFQHEESWSKSMGIHESMLQKLQINESNNRAAIAVDYIKSMNKLGFHHLSDVYLKGLRLVSCDSSVDLIDLQLESAWRNREWDADLASAPQTLSRCTFECLQSFSVGNNEKLARVMLDAFSSIIDRFKSGAFEGTTRLQGIMLPLLSFIEIEEGSRLHTENDLLQMLSLWNKRSSALMQQISFIDFEIVLASRTVILEAISQILVKSVPGMKPTLNTFMRYHLLQLTKLARKSGHIQIASNSLYRLRSLLPSEDCKMSPEDFAWLANSTVEDAKLLWAQGESSIAIKTIRQLLKNVETTPHCKFKFWNDHSFEPTVVSKESVIARLLNKLGVWIAETRSERPTNIMSDFFEKAATLRTKQESLHKSGKIFYSLAKYAEEQYEIYLNPEKTELGNAISRHKDELAKYRRLNKNNVHCHKIAMQIEADEADYNRVMHDGNTFLEKSIENYLRCLQASDKFDMSVFRLCSLWFANDTNEVVNALIANHVDRIPSRKWVVLMFQLSGRLSARISSNLGRIDSFQDALTRLVERICRDHPFHGLYQIFALCNAKYGSSKSTNVSDLDDSRAEAAIRIIKRLTKLPEILKDIKALCVAYLDLAFKKIEDYKPQDMGNHDWIQKYGKTAITDFRHKPTIPVPTLDLPIDHECLYRDFVSINKFENVFTCMKGTRKPKLINCIGSDGRAYKQLVKANDDLRQDAVMQQVFRIVHVLLEKNLETRKRRLGIRTYKVIPLSRQSGLVEWVENTTTFGAYLDDAHIRYYRDDMRFQECRMRIQSSTPESKLRVYMEIIKQTHPVFRHFFLERFHNPPEWFERRLAYVRSVASSSIMGHILGLGDRHPQNILIDEKTAEIVHIDLGIAFDLGKVLRVPELVPFRLTRNIVDGFGITGVDGVFRCCCEKTLSVLQSQSSVLLTILEVFRYDPLYQWTLHPLKALRVQNESSMLEAPDNEVNVQGIPRQNKDEADDSSQIAVEPIHPNNYQADRALRNVRDRLATNLSAECHVNDLIQMATDQMNLARMYDGWQPWC